MIAPLDECIHMQVASDGKSTQEQWRKSYVPVLSAASVGNGSTVVTPAVKARPVSAASPISESAATERKKRQAPKPPGVGGTLQTSVGSPNGSVSSGCEDRRSSVPPTECPVSSASPVTDNRTTPVSTTVTGKPERPERMKRHAPAAPGFPASGPAGGRQAASSTSPVQLAAEQKEPAGRETNTSMLGGCDEITLNMDEVEFVPPERPKTIHTTAPGPVMKVDPLSPAPKDSTDINIAGLAVQCSALDSQNETVTESPQHSGDGEQRSESGQQDGVPITIESTVDTSSLESDSVVADSMVVSDRSKDVVYTASVQSSTVGSKADSDRASPDQNHDVASLQKSNGLLTHAVGNPPHTQVTAETTFQSEKEHDELTKPASSDQHRNSAVSAVQLSEDKKNNAAEVVPSTSLGSPATVEMTLTNSANSVEMRSPVTAEKEPLSFRISEKEVKQKRGELASATQPAFDTAWKSSGDGGRFRIRSVAKNVSYAEVFGDDTTTTRGGKTPHQRREFAGNSNRAHGGITADVKPVGDPVCDGDGCEKETPTAVNRCAELSETVPDDAGNSQHQNEAASKLANPILTLELPSYAGKDDKNTVPEKQELRDNPCADVDRCQTVDSEPVVSVTDRQDVLTGSENVLRPECNYRSPTTASNGDILPDADKPVDRVTDNSELVSSTVSLDAGKSDTKSADYTQKFSRGKATRRQPETIVINKSNLSSAAGGLGRRSHATSRSPSEAKSVAEPVQSAGRAAKISTTSATSVDENRLQKRSELRGVADEFPRKMSTVVDTRNAVAAEPTGSVGRSAAVAPKQENSTSTVVRIVNGCIVHDSSSALSKSPNTVPKTSNVTVVQSDQSLNDTASTKFKVVGDGYSAKTTDTLMSAAPVTTAETGIDVQPSATESIGELSTSTQSVASRISSPSSAGETGTKTHVEDGEIVIPEWRRVTTRSMPESVQQLPVHSGPRESNAPRVSSESRLKADTSSGSVRKPTTSPENAGSTTVYGALVHPTQVSSNVNSGTVTPKPSGSQHRASLPADKVSASASTDNSEEEQSSVLTQARSMLRPAYRPVTYEVPSSDGGDSPASKFVLRTASSSARRTFTATNAEGRNSVEHKPAQVGIDSKTTDTENQYYSRTFKSVRAPYAGTSSTLPATVKYSGR